MDHRPTTVFLAVSFEPLRAGLDDMISTAPDLEVCGQAPFLDTAVETGPFWAADLILLDVDALNRSDMPKVFQALGDGISRLKVLFLGQMEDAIRMPFETLLTLLELDTFGFIVKNGTSDRLLEAIRLISSRTFVCESDVIKRVLYRLSQWATYQPNNEAERLSEREKEVLRLVAEGMSNREIARELFLAEGTIKSHVSHIMAKLSVERRAKLVKQALLSGLVAVSSTPG